MSMHKTTALLATALVTVPAVALNNKSYHGTYCRSEVPSEATPGVSGLEVHAAVPVYCPLVRDDMGGTETIYDSAVELYVAAGTRSCTLVTLMESYTGTLGEAPLQDSVTLYTESTGNVQLGPFLQEDDDKILTSYGNGTYGGTYQLRCDLDDGDILYHVWILET